jgi:hypothetical protein
MSANGKTDFLTPKQELFLSCYTNPNSETFGNALQSALKAGFGQEYAESITYKMPEWLADNVGSMKLLAKAEKVLNKTLDDDYDESEILIDGIPSGKTKKEASLSKIKQDSAKFIASTVGKKKYSTKGDEGISKLAQAITGMRFEEEKDSSVES